MKNKKQLKKKNFSAKLIFFENLSILKRKKVTFPTLISLAGSLSAFFGTVSFLSRFVAVEAEPEVDGSSLRALASLAVDKLDDESRRGRVNTFEPFPLVA